MKLAYNFISAVVAVGNFNTSIITLSFLEECKLQFGKPVEMSAPEIPVHRGIKFKNIAFDVLIDKFIITENNPEKIDSLLVVDAFQEIFGLLPYTPLKAVGININCDIFFHDGAKAKRWISSASDP